MASNAYPIAFETISQLHPRLVQLNSEMHRSRPGENARLLSSFSCQQSGVAEECTNIFPQDCKLFAITSALIPYHHIHSCTLRSARRYFCLQVFRELSGGRKTTWQLESLPLFGQHSNRKRYPAGSRRVPSSAQANHPVMVESSSFSKALWILSTSVWMIYSFLVLNEAQPRKLPTSYRMVL